MAMPSVSMDNPPSRGGMVAPPSGFDHNSLVGPPVSSQAADTSKQDQSKGVVAQFKGVHTQLDDLARQFPAGAKELRRAQDAMKNAMVKIISELQRPAQGGSAVG